MTSDEFFASPRGLYDLMFVDGLHQEAQVARDLLNGLSVLAPGGTIVAHDCNLVTEFAQTEAPNGGVWNGTVWKSWLRLRATRADLSMIVVDIDHGCGVLRGGRQELYPLPETLDFAFFDEHRKEALPLVSVDTFLSDLLSWDA